MIAFLLQMFGRNYILQQKSSLWIFLLVQFHFTMNQKFFCFREQKNSVAENPLTLSSQNFGGRYTENLY